MQPDGRNFEKVVLMINRMKLPAGLCLVVLALFLGSCSKESNDTTAQAAGTSEAQGSGERGDVAQSTQPQDASASSAAYTELLTQVRSMERSAGGSQETMMTMIAKMEGLFKGFIAKYPESVEAKDARFQLGLIYTTLQRGPEAVVQLREYIATSEGENVDKVGYAHYYLAEALKASDEFDEARKHYQTFITDYPTANPQAVAQAKMAMEDLETLKKLAIGADPIDFSVKGINGESLDLDNYKGKVVLLDFWATWCAPCRVEMPNVVRLHEKYGDEGFEIIGVSLDQNRTAFDRYIRANNMAWSHYFDGRGWSNEIAMKYKIRSIPATFLIDRRGKIRYRSIRGKALEDAVQKLLGETS